LAKLEQKTYLYEIQKYVPDVLAMFFENFAFILSFYFFGLGNPGSTHISLGSFMFIGN
jgi:hypothetical protein